MKDADLIVDGCIDLRLLSNGKYQITHDIAYDPQSRDPDMQGPHYLIIRCKYGHIFPMDERSLCIDLDEFNTRKAKALQRIGCVLIRDSDEGVTLSFPVDKFNEVAAIVKPHRVRSYTDSERENARQAMTKLNEVRRLPRGLFGPNAASNHLDDSVVMRDGLMA